MTTTVITGVSLMGEKGSDVAESPMVFVCALWSQVSSKARVIDAMA